MSRLDHLIQFYALLEELEQKCGGKRTLAACSGRLVWPRRGVYFFFEPGEARSGSGSGPRVVRVGTHALTATSKSGLWDRLSQHRGTKSGGGNHRGSIFRLLVGTALRAQGAPDPLATWDIGSSASQAADLRSIDRTLLLRTESDLEAAVSQYIGTLPFLWLEVGGDGGRGCAREIIERSSIALLSEIGKAAVDPPSSSWLGYLCDRERVRLSGLWNSNHADEEYRFDFLELFSRHISSLRVSPASQA